MQLEPVIGLEVHLQPKTKSKMFCPCSADIWKAESNSRVCPVCLGYPGALPVPNIEAIRKCQLLGIALSCQLAGLSKFDRKNYFYPDLPKGYQISQYDEPLCVNGNITLASGKVIRIRRVHMEEDTGKSLHGDSDTLLDFNKSGMPLCEIVTEPDFSDPEEVYEFGKRVRDIARKYSISDCDMEKGQMRLEASISMRSVGQKELPNYRAEIKNINSFKFVVMALKSEIVRQTAELMNGSILKNETRGFDEKLGTFLMREKEGEKDYRYFPEPDIPPMSFSTDYLNEIKEEIRKKEEETNTKENKNETKQERPQKVYLMLEDQVLDIVKSVILENSSVAAQIKTGKTNAAMFLVGQVVKNAKGQADPKIIKKLIDSLIR